MKKQNNSAGRVYKIFDQLKSYHDTHYMRDVWIQIFAINISTRHKTAFETSRKLNLLHDELLAVRKGMESTGFSKTLYESAYDIVEKIIYVETLSNQLSSYRSHLTDGFYNSLLLCAEALPDEEGELISKSDLDSLSAELGELKEKVKGGNLPEVVKDFIYRQIAVIERAISDHQIIGVQAFKNAYDTAIVDLVESQEIVRPFTDTDEISALGKLWGLVVRYGEPAFKYIGYINNTAKLIEGVVKILS